MAICNSKCIAQGNIICGCLFFGDVDEITIRGNKIIYDNKIYDLSKDIGMSIYFNGNKVITIRDDIGKRYWNK